MPNIASLSQIKCSDALSKLFPQFPLASHIALETLGLFVGDESLRWLHTDLVGVLSVGEDCFAPLYTHGDRGMPDSLACQIGCEYFLQPLALVPGSESTCDSPCRCRTRGRFGRPINLKPIRRKCRRAMRLPTRIHRHWPYQLDPIRALTFHQMWAIDIASVGDMLCGQQLFCCQSEIESHLSSPYLGWLRLLFPHGSANAGSHHSQVSVRCTDVTGPHRAALDAHMRIEIIGRGDQKRRRGRANASKFCRSPHEVYEYWKGEFQGNWCSIRP
jgi:hypothetical protein